MLPSLHPPALAIVALVVVVSVAGRGGDGGQAALRVRQMGLHSARPVMSPREDVTNPNTHLPTSHGVFQDRFSDSKALPDFQHQQQHRTAHSETFDPHRHSRRNRFTTTNPSNNFHSRLDSVRKWDVGLISHPNSSYLPHSDAHAVGPSSSRSFRVQESHDSQSQPSYDRRRRLSSFNAPYSRIRTRQNYSPYASSSGNSSRPTASGTDRLELPNQHGTAIPRNPNEIPESKANPRQTEFHGRNLTHPHHRRTHSSSEIDFSRSRSNGRDPATSGDTLSRSIDEIVHFRQTALRDQQSPQRTANNDQAESSPRENRSQIQEVEEPRASRLQDDQGENQNNETSTRRKKGQKKQKKKKKRRNRNRRNRSNKGRKKRRRLQNLISEQNLQVHDVEGESFLDCCPSKLVVIEKQVGKARDNHAVELHPDSQYFYERVCLDQFEGEECIFPSRALKPWVKTRCAPTYSFSQALVRRYASEDDWSLDYVEVSSGCSCQVSLDSVPSNSRSERNSSSTSRH